MINDTGNGTPTLQSALLQASWDDFVGGTTVSGIPGTTVQLHAENTISIGPNQTGTGSTTTSINWGTLTGWSQTGRLLCVTNCPGGCGGASSCKPFVGFEGLGAEFGSAGGGGGRTGPPYAGGGCHGGGAGGSVIRRAPARPAPPWR